MLLLFMPRPSILFEIFPYKYYKGGYEDLSVSYQMTYNYIQSSSSHLDPVPKFILSRISLDTCQNSKYCRSYARSFPVG